MEMRITGYDGSGFVALASARKCRASQESAPETGTASGSRLASGATARTPDRDIPQFRRARARCRKDPDRWQKVRGRSVRQPPGCQPAQRLAVRGQRESR